MMRGQTSIRFRLTVWYALVLAAGLILFAALLWISLRHTLRKEIDEALLYHGNSFEVFLKAEIAEVPSPPLAEELEEFCRALPSSSYLQVRNPQGNFRFSFPANWPDPKTGNAHRLGFADVRFNGHAFRDLHREINTQKGRYAMAIGMPLDAVQHVVNLLEVMLLGLIPTVLLIGCFGSLWLSRRALRPVDAMTTAARSISIDNLSSRLPVPATSDELQRLAEAWNTMLKRLEAAVKSISQFAADASHELRTPLAIIHTSAELSLRRTRSPEQYRASLQQIEAETDRMTRLVEDLLFLARNDASSVEMALEPTDLCGLLKEVCSESQPLADAHEIAIQRAPQKTTIVLMSNKPALRRLFQVLLENAIKYSERRSEVHVRITRTADIVEVSIEDSGVGISAEELPHIFKRFYRSETARSRSVAGQGLGLSLAESLARRHNATISVRSTPGEGSEFRVTFACGQHSPTTEATHYSEKVLT